MFKELKGFKEFNALKNPPLSYRGSSPTKGEVRRGGRNCARRPRRAGRVLRSSGRGLSPICPICPISLISPIRSTKHSRVLKKIPASIRRTIIFNFQFSISKAVGINLSCFSGRPSRPFSLPLLVAKVAQKPRTASLAGARLAKSKTNATRSKRLPSSFFNAFATLARHDRQGSRFSSDDASAFLLQTPSRFADSP